MNTHIVKWKTEHDNFIRLLDVIDTQIARFHDGMRPDYELMLDVMHYMTHYPDRYHHPREDGAYAAVLDYAPQLRDTAAQLAEQHIRIARCGEQLVEDLGAIIDGAVMPRAKVEADAAAYTGLMREHMQQEQAQIYPAVEQHLTPADWLLIDARIYFIDDPIFGERVEARYRNLHREIAAQVGCGCTVTG